MGRRSSVDRAGVREPFLALLAGGATIDAITAELNEVLAEAGREERLSRSAVGRAAARHAPILEAKRRADELVAQLGDAGAGTSPRASQGRLELLRTLLLSCAARMGADDDDAPSAAEIKDVAGAWLNVERAADLTVKREAMAAERARREAAERAGRTARRQGLSEDTVRAIRAAVEGE